MKKLTTSDFIEKSISIHGNLYDYSKVYYYKSKVKVEIICNQENHGSFFIRPNNHLNGQGCPKCGLNFMKNGEFVKKAKCLHNDKYIYIEEYSRNDKPIKIFCKRCEKEFTQTPNSHLCGCGCPNCQKTNLQDFIERSNKIHNYKYNYSKSHFDNQNDLINIYCESHGLFKQKVSNHLNGHGCKKCGYDKIKISSHDFIKRSNKIHNNKYKYHDYTSLNSSTLIEIECPNHGDFKQKVHNHLKGHGCRKCYVESLRLSNEDFIYMSERIHNYKYDYSLVKYKNNSEKVVIKCPIHGRFDQTPNIHIKGSGCPICKSSKGEKRILNFLKSNNIPYKTQYVFDDCYHKSKLRYDFYLPDHNTIIEYGGRQHFEPIEKWGGYGEFENIKLRDEIKNNYCMENNIYLIRIPYNKFSRIEEILSKK